VAAHYYTSGVPGSQDVEIAKNLAALMGVRHAVEMMSEEEVLLGWEASARRIIRQNDGMLNIIQVADLVRQPEHIDRLEPTLWGIAGAVARGHLSDPKLLARRWTTAGMKAFMVEVLADTHGGLVRPAAFHESRRLIEELGDRFAGEGFAPLDIPDVLFTWDRMRRWGGTNARKAMPAGERFSPYVTRAFIEATFALSPAQRYCEPLHFGLVRTFAPELDQIPYDKGPWRSQRPAVNFVRWFQNAVGQKAAHLTGRRGQSLGAPPRRFSTFDHGAWLVRKRDWWRSLCLDQAQSSIWDLVDRTLFERLAAQQTEASELRRRTRGLYNTITLFAYEAERRAEPASGCPESTVPAFPSS
jgi:asparagine synthase (glutamine-hydrolysing)